MKRVLFLWLIVSKCQGKPLATPQKKTKNEITILKERMDDKDAIHPSRISQLTF
jgi:hypothetical protein